MAVGFRGLRDGGVDCMATEASGEACKMRHFVCGNGHNGGFL